MRFPLQIQFRGIEKSDFVYNDIWDHIEKLERFYDRIVSCRVLVSLPHQHRHKGRIYHVQIYLFLPGGEIYITSDPEKNEAHADVYVAVRDAFSAARRRLEDFIRKERGVVKEHHATPHAKVIRIYFGEGYGFMETPDGREIYFHENAVLNHGFNSLRVGDEVRFEEEAGESGPQATYLVKVGHSG